jgi:hypothetical protein
MTTGNYAGAGLTISLAFWYSRIYLKVQRNENFLASILNIVLFHCYLCINNKILGKIFFDWTIIGGATIIPRSLKTKRNKKKFQDRPIFFFFFFLNHI